MAAVSLGAAPPTNRSDLIPPNPKEYIKPYLNTFSRGYQLYSSNRHAEAYTCLEALITTNQPIPPGPVSLIVPMVADLRWHAEFLMGQIQQRLGNLDKAAEHYAHVAEAREGMQSNANLVTDLIEEIFVRERLYQVYSLQGKLGLGLVAHTKAEDLLQKFLVLESEEPPDTVSLMSVQRFLASDPTRPKRHPSWWDALWQVKGNRANLLWRAGQFDDAEALYQDVAAEAFALTLPEALAKKNAPSTTMEQPSQIPIRCLGWAWHGLANLASLWERCDDAISYSEKIQSLPYSAEFLYARHQRAIAHAAWLAERDGPSQKVWSLVDGALENLQAEDHETWLGCNITKCEMLAEDGKSGEASKLLNQMIETARVRNYQRDLASALKLRARLALDVGEIVAAATDLKESLALYRSLGWKHVEPGLYELQAKCLARQGRYAEALQTWEDAYQMAETLKLHHRSLHMLLGIADLQLRLGDKVTLERTWARIDKFISVYPGLPEPTQLRLHLARLEYLKSLADRVNLLAAFQEAQRFVKSSKLTAYQSRTLSEFKLDMPAATVAAVTRPAPVVALPAAVGLLPTVDLQPILMTTRVSAGELAHARFILVNPSAQVARGTLQLAAEELVGEWISTEHGATITLRPGAGATNTPMPVELDPGSAHALYLEAPPAFSKSTNLISLAWHGDRTNEARWAFGAVSDPREVAIVNASLAKENPFYSVVFYHELYYRGRTQAVQNLRVTANQPCRVEIVDALTMSFLAVDANGDGDFEDEGDVLYADSDADGYPDLKLTSGHDLAAFELRVYPTGKANPAPQEMEVTLSRQEAGTWTAEAVDVLRMR